MKKLQTWAYDGKYRLHLEEDEDKIRAGWAALADNAEEIAAGAVLAERARIMEAVHGLAEHGEWCGQGAGHWVPALSKAAVLALLELTGD